MQTEIKNRETLTRVIDDFFVGWPVSVNEEIEGYRLDDQNNFVLGCRAGPSLSVSNLMHEMGHLAEREIPKLLEKPQYGWGYHPGKYWEVAGKSGWESTNAKSVEREIRVCAYQWSLMGHYGITVGEDEEREDSTEYMADSLHYLDAWMFYTRKHWDEKLNYQQNQQHAKEICQREIETLSAGDFSFERFKLAWFERMRLL